MDTYVAAIVGDGPAASHVTDVLRQHLRPECDLVSVNSIAELDALANLAIIITSLDRSDGSIEELRSFFLRPNNEHVRLIAVTRQRIVDHLGPLMTLGKPDYLAYLAETSDEQLRINVDHQLRRFQLYAGKTVTRSTPFTGLFHLDVDMSESSIVEEILQRADRLLGYQPRIKIPSGVVLIKEGEPVDEVYFTLDGRISLQRKSDAGDIVMHHASTGRIIGLLALMQGTTASLTGTTTTEVLAVHMTFEQINQLIDLDATIVHLLSALTMRSLDRRLRRAEDIQVEKVELASELDIERRNLATAVRNLEAARAELTAQARFASLGELAAGVAHELNNPMAAIRRTAEHIADDVHRLIASAHDKKWAAQTTTALDAAREASVLSTREARLLRQDFTEITGDGALSQRLVLAGIRDPQFVRTITKSRRTSADTIETAASIGSALRNLDTASSRISRLVASLRAYARPDGDPVTDVDLNETIEDTLRLISHRLRDLKIERDYGDLPTIACHPGELGQVWTNLLTNAAEALADVRAVDPSRGHIRVETLATAENTVTVRVIDDGPGIPAEIIDRLFEPRFTTKNGQVRFGMGIGLGICQSIISKHHGVITLDSSSAGTVATVRLPLAGPLSPTLINQPNLQEEL